SMPIGRFGHRRSYVLISIPLIIGGWILLPLATEAILFIAIIFITTLGFYLGDVAVDGWAVDVTPESERGSMMGLGWGAQGIASVIGVLVTTLMAPIYGYATAFITLGIIAGIGNLVWFLVAKEKPVAEPRHYSKTFNELVSELRHSYLWLAFLAFIGGGFIFGVGTNFITLFYEDVVGVDSTGAGIFVLVWSAFFFVGGIIGGFSYDRFKDYRTGVYVIAPIYAISLVLMGLNSTGNMGLAYATTILFGLGSGMTTAAIMGFAMHITPPAIAGTTFAILTSLVNLGQSGIGNVFLGFMVPQFGYVIPFIIGAIVAIPVILLAKFIIPPWKKEQLQEPVS
ncbi:MAG: MFS transporter, partial [Candidatus Thorarchaeota archaeon]